MNQLHRIDAFRAALANYELSPSAKETLRMTRLALLVGPTSSGRNTIINELLKTDAYHFIVSDTTRTPRINNGVLEENGREYWFRTEEDVLRDLQNGAFLEAAIIHGQQVSGISIREIEKAHQSGQIAITDIEPKGAATVHTLKPDATILFVVPPDFDAWMQRLRGRSDMPEEEVRRRLEAACDEIQTALANEYYTFVLNDTFTHAVADAVAIIRQEAIDTDAQMIARQAATRLRTDARAYLNHVR